MLRGDCWLHETAVKISGCIQKEHVTYSFIRAANRRSAVGRRSRRHAPPMTVSAFAGGTSARLAQRARPAQRCRAARAMSDTPAENDGAAHRRERPPLRYTEDFETPASVTLDVIGVIRSPYKERFGTPRQPGVTARTLGGAPQRARIELRNDARYTLALRGLAAFEYCWIIAHFHLNTGWNPLVRPPRGPRRKHGVLATRSPHHPNPIGLSCVRIETVDEAARVIHVRGIDLLDGTPVLDIKPCAYRRVYRARANLLAFADRANMRADVPYCDAFPNAKAGWLDELDESMTAPDALSYDPPPAHLMRALTPPGSPNTVERNGENSGAPLDA